MIEPRFVLERMAGEVAAVELEIPRGRENEAPLLQVDLDRHAVQEEAEDAVHPVGRTPSAAPRAA